MLASDFAIAILGYNNFSDFRGAKLFKSSLSSLQKFVMLQKFVIFSAHL